MDNNRFKQTAYNNNIEKITKLLSGTSFIYFNLINSIITNDIGMVKLLIKHKQYDPIEKILIDNNIMLMIAAYILNIEILNMIMEISPCLDKMKLRLSMLNYQITNTAYSTICSFYDI